MSFRLSRLILPVIVLAAAGGGYLWWRDSAKPVPVSFKTAAITRGTLTQTVTATGDLQPVATVEVSSQISGLIKEVLVDYNSKVKAGDVLARIDPATYETRLQSAQAELANTSANYRLVKLNADRIKSLNERKLVSQQELDQVVAQLAQAEAQLQIRTASVETAKVDLARCTITAPIDGSVLDRPAIAGKTVSASTSAPILFVLVNDLRLLQIKAAIAEADIGTVREGQNVAFTVDAFPGQSFRGVVQQIRNQPVTQSNVVTYATIIDVNNDNLTLKPGMTANVTVTVQEKTNALIVTNAALRVRLDDAVKLPALPPSPEVAAAAADKPAAPANPFRELLKEVGYKQGEGRPTEAQMTKVRALAAERGIELPQPGEGGGRRRPAASAPVLETVRTLFKPVDQPTGPRAQPIEVRLGITDGINTEVIAGLAQDDKVITGVLDPAAAKAATAAPSSPFSPTRRF
ncbi:MAG: efflux RND transporter periplasmic adaptor subunit [Verrucomicrobia bacterium]|nr:efflux RND transporter periplasmic adaptor subunit [Verrucomicrobiota bacterium]